MTVRLLRLITSLRPSKSRPAFLQAVRSSATQGSVSFPSTSSLRWDGVSTMEILNILEPGTNQVSAMRVPKAQGRKVLKRLTGEKSAERYVNNCQRLT